MIKKLDKRLIIFDCDGVLVNTEMITSRVLAQQMQELGVSITSEEINQKFAGGNIYDTFKYFEKCLKHPLPEDFYSNYRKRTFEIFKTDLKAIPYIKEVIEQLPFPKCVGSNGPQHKMKLNLQLTGLYDYFQGNLFSAYDIECWKPKPDLYLYAAKNMGFEPQNCMVVEDSAFGVQAGLRAGMKVFWYQPHQKEAIMEKEKITCFNDMRLLLNLIS